MKVLIVDDVAANRLVLRALLTRTGHEALAAANGEEARRVFAAERPEAVLTDLHLGAGEDGLALAAALRALPGGATVRIALMTADPPREPLPPGSADAVLEKPVSIEAITRFMEG